MRESCLNHYAAGHKGERQAGTDFPRHLKCHAIDIVEVNFSSLECKKKLHLQNVERLQSCILAGG